MANKLDLTEEQIMQLSTQLMGLVDSMLGDRAEPVRAMYADYGMELATAPASTKHHYHNAFVGGYLDHILRVVEFSFEIHSLWEKSGLDVSMFTMEELVFSALHHDLGKLGFPKDGMNKYVLNDNQWRVENLGEVYKINDKTPFALVPDLALFILQKYNIPVTWNETLAIKLADGPYDENNRAYLFSNRPESALRTTLPHIIHQADLMATKFEQQRWMREFQIDYPNYEE